MDRAKWLTSINKILSAEKYGWCTIAVAKRVFSAIMIMLVTDDKPDPYKDSMAGQLWIISFKLRISV